MKEKNRFSSLLKHLMSVAKLKNYTLAKELQYDESYISKWANGNLLPTEKTSDKILRDISRCVISSLDEESRATLYSEYQVDHDDDLEMAIFDNLEAEFNYVLDLKESTGSEIAPKTTFYPELTLAQFLQKMRHPVLRQVKSLDVITAVDILSLDKNYQMSMAELQNAPNVNVSQRSYPGVHFSMLINLDSVEQDLLKNVHFILNLLSNLSSINFQLYLCPQAHGKIIFSVRDAYCISGMIMDENHCVAVSSSEETKNCNAIYDRLQSMCTQEMLIVRRTTMAEMLAGKDYVQSLFSRNLNWSLGHLTEHFLPDDLYCELADEFCHTHLELNREQMDKVHMFSRSVLENMDVRILCCKNAINDFVITGTLDFFNTKITLTPQQRMRVLTYCAELYERNPKIGFRILDGDQVSDLQHIPTPTLFLSNSTCYLRLVRPGPTNNLSVVHKLPVCDLLRRVFDLLWEGTGFIEKDPHAIADIFRYAMQMVEVQIHLNS